MVSKFNQSLIRQKLIKMTESAPGLFQRLNKKSISVMVRTRGIDLLRAEVFLDDLNVLSGGEYQHYFTFTPFVQLLYDDFLLQIRKQYSPVEMANRLVSRRRKYFNNQDGLCSHTLKSKWFLIPVPLERPLVLRGEVFLHDLTVSCPGFKMNLSALLSILVLDFISEIRKGNQQELIRMIVNRLEQD
ncbi:hypothetical protein ACFPYJ_18235 [Paenibacillus solisilvae]|uniref:Uncharacterized protein n=1 Tax=Paenibacillus solisilvae TaxID=2486751 RepID=A0ABW0W1W3_9BACL